VDEPDKRMRAAEQLAEFLPPEILDTGLKELFGRCVGVADPAALVEQQHGVGKCVEDRADIDIRTGDGRRVRIAVRQTFLLR